MRGLAVFISDLRNARARELEEKRINTELAKIRAKFRDAKLSGYDRKKYVCKLLYMYILGWNVDFGHLEAVALISSTKYSEKQIGYLGVTLFLNEHHDLIHLVVNSIKKDLIDNNELFNCLALHCIANIGSSEMAVALAADVHQLLVSGSSKTFVKKKAALTLLRLYRRSPGIIERPWIQKIISIMDDQDLGVVISVVSLITDLAHDDPETFIPAYQRAVYRLKTIVIDGQYDHEYLYYKVPCPWLQVKLMKLLQLFPPPSDPLLFDLLTEVLEHIMRTSETQSKSVQQNNAQNAILFQAVDLAMHIEVKDDLASQIIALMSHFLSSKETNVRYLGLETLSRLAGRAGLLRDLRDHQQTVSQSLKDRDISVRRRALDLLYAMCDKSNAKQIISELLRHLQISDYSIREELVLKIAVLVEKFATEYEWYITITLQLLAVAGDHVANEVWQRVIQIIANNEALQEHAARSVLAYMRVSACHENLVKVGGLVLGEFGHLIANEENCSPIEQFSALHSKFNLATTATRAILLSTYIKFLNVFPELEAEITLVFRQFQDILDTELQQRACEYLALAEMPSDDLLQAVCEEMPPYPEKTSKLLLKLYSKENEQGPHIVSRPETLARNMSSQQTSAMTGSRPQSQSNGKDTSHPEHIHLSPNWEPGYARLLWKDRGVLYEDHQILILVKGDYRASTGQITLTYVNKSETSYTAFTTVINHTQSSCLVLRGVDIVPSKLDARSQIQQSISVECLNVYDDAPTVRVNYLAGALQELVLRLPVVLDKFLVAPGNMNTAIFQSKWDLLQSPELSSTETVLLNAVRDQPLHERLEKIVAGHRWTTITSNRAAGDKISAASILQTRDGKSIGCLMQVTPSERWTKLEITVRASAPIVAETLRKLLVSNLTTSLTQFEGTR